MHLSHCEVTDDCIDCSKPSKLARPGTFLGTIFMRDIQVYNTSHVHILSDPRNAGSV
jgi:hypothetical protein